MSYRGMMDGWHVDETECLGSCGQCQSCEDNYYQRCDDEYDNYRDEQ